VLSYLLKHVGDNELSIRPRTSSVEVENLNPILLRTQCPLQQFVCTREVRVRHIFDVMHVSQRVLDYQDIPVFEIRTVHISKSAQQAIGQRQVYENFTKDGERCRPSVGSVMDHMCEVRAT